MKRMIITYDPTFDEYCIDCYNGSARFYSDTTKSFKEARAIAAAFAKREIFEEVIVQSMKFSQKKKYLYHNGAYMVVGGTKGEQE